MAEATDYDPKRMFGQPAMTKWEVKIWERGRQPAKGVGVKPSGLIGGGRTPLP